MNINRHRQPHVSQQNTTLKQNDPDYYQRAKFWAYLFNLFYGSAHRVMVIVVGTGHNDLSSNQETSHSNIVGQTKFLILILRRVRNLLNSNQFYADLEKDFVSHPIHNGGVSFIIKKLILDRTGSIAGYVRPRELTSRVFPKLTYYITWGFTGPKL